MIQFILGAIVGGIAAYVYRDRIKTYMNEKLPTVRDRAADKLGVVGKGAEDVLDRAKSTIGSNIRAGQERLRTVGGGRPASGTGPSGSADAPRSDEPRAGGWPTPSR